MSEDLIGRMAIAEIASCGCLTKAFDLKLHDPFCKYRVLVEARDRIQALEAELSGVRAGTHVIETVDPSEAMLNAGGDALSDVGLDNAQNTDAEIVYRAMIKASKGDEKP